MNAVILSGGFGNRLKPLTENTPKPMLTVANTPILDYSVSHLYRCGIREFIFTCAFRPEKIIEFAIGYTGIQCRFSVETVPLGTLGGIKENERFLDDIFLVTSGDIIENIDFAAMLTQHMTSGAAVTAAVTEVPDPSCFGVYEVQADGRVSGFKEKPLRGTEKSKLAGCGVYIMNKKVLKRIDGVVKADIALDLLPSLVQSGELSAFIHTGYWRDCGTPESYFSANFEMAGGPFFDRAPNGRCARFASFRTAAGEPSVTSVTAVTDGAVQSSIVGAGAYITAEAEIERCVVLQNAVVKGKFQNCIIGPDFVIEVANAPFVPANLADSSIFLK